jgi:hypothetical protein
LERNKKYFHQADDTPFAGGAENMVLYDLLGYTGMSKAAKDMVDGTFLEKYGDEVNVLPEMEQVIRVATCHAQGNQSPWQEDRL